MVLKRARQGGNQRVKIDSANIQIKPNKGFKVEGFSRK